MWDVERINRSVECAMQLVRLGADPNRTLNLCNADETTHSGACRLVGFDGQSALQLARMTKRRDLVELMERHLRNTPEERTQVVHYRCGSRLLWKACHGIGIGHPPHLRTISNDGVAYLLAPHARCPCSINCEAVLRLLLLEGHGVLRLPP